MPGAAVMQTGKSLVEDVLFSLDVGGGSLSVSE